jgi:tetratricopeptide (TPR) repeat protein
MKRVYYIILLLFISSDAFSLELKNIYCKKEKVLIDAFAFLPDSNNDSALAMITIGLHLHDSGEYAMAISYYTKALQFDPSIASAYINRAHAKYQLMDYQGALNDYAQAQKLKLTWEESYELYYFRGLTLVALRNLRQAMSDFNYSIRLNPDQPDAYYNRSILKGRIGDYQGELEDLNKAAQLKPEDDNIYNSRGITKSMIGDITGAVQDYAKSIELNKLNPDPYFNRGIILYDMGKYLEALNDFNKVIELKPDAEAYNRRANAKCRLKDYKGAFEDYNAAINFDSTNYVAFINRGYLKYDLKDYKSAIDDYDKALKIKPDYAMAYYNRGQAKGKLGDLNGEIEDYTQAIEYKPDYPNAYIERGMARYEKGDRTGGCFDLSQAVKLGSDQAYNHLKEYCR